MSSARSDEAKPKLSSDELAALLSTLQAEVIGLKMRFTESETRNEALEETIVNLTHENELLKRRIYGNKTERTGTSELQLTLGDLLDSEKQLQKELDAAVAAARVSGHPNRRLVGQHGGRAQIRAGLKTRFARPEMAGNWA